MLYHNSKIGNIYAIETGRYDTGFSSIGEIIETITFRKPFDRIPIVAIGLRRSGYTNKTAYQLNDIGKDRFKFSAFCYDENPVNSGISIYWVAIDCGDRV